jgi:peptide/nickel transport system permease protein
MSAAPQLERGASPLAAFCREFAESRLALAALGVFVLAAVVAIAAPLITPQNPYDQSALSLIDARLPPGEIGSGGYTHWLGTDAGGRDLLSAILWGLRISLGVGVLAGGVALLIGATLGLLAAFYGRWLEATIMRVVDLQLSFPAIMMALVLVAIVGQGVGQIVTALVAAQYAYFARTVHGAALAERRKEYIEAALGVPLGNRRVLFRHLLPNCLPPLIVVGSVQVANSIAIEATLSFLGVGLPITEPSLGVLISNGFQYMLSGRYWISVYPGVALLIVLMSINLVGDQLRDVLNPRLKR